MDGLGSHQEFERLERETADVDNLQDDLADSGGDLGGDADLLGRDRFHDVVQNERGIRVRIACARDAHLTVFGKVKGHEKANGLVAVAPLDYEECLAGQ